VNNSGLYITPDGKGKALVTEFSNFKKYKYSKPELCWTVDWPNKQGLRGIYGNRRI